MKTFIARCIARSSSGAPVAAKLVAKAHDPSDLHEMAERALRQSDYRFERVDQILADGSNHQLSGDTDLFTPFAADLSPAHSLQLGGFYPLPRGAEDMGTGPVLQVDRHSLPAPQDDEEKPFWDIPWCPPDLAKLAFGGDMRTYALIDAGKRAEIMGHSDIEELLDQADLNCLFLTDRKGDLTKVAPYLIDITSFADGSTPVPIPLRTLFSQDWQGGAVLLVRSAADIETLRGHLRRFTRIRSDNDAKMWTFFRFWSPSTARVYFPGIADRPDRAHRFFWIGPDLPLQLLVPDGADTLHIFPVRDVPRGMKRGEIVFDDRDHALMEEVVQRVFAEELETWLCDTHPDRFADMSKEQIGAATSHILIEGRRLGFVQKEDFVYLAHMMLTFGGRFVQAQHPAPLVDILTTSDSSPRPKVRSIFVSTYKDSPQGTLMAAWDDVRAHLLALPDQDSVTPEVFRDFLRRFLVSKAADVEAALAATKLDLKALNLPINIQGRLLILTLVYGHQFHADPLRAWPRLPLDQRIDYIWDIMLQS